VGQLEPSTGVSTDEAPTTAESPAAVSGRPLRSSRRPSDIPSSDTTESRGTAPSTPREMLHAEEIARTRVFVVVAGFFACLVAIALPALGGDQVAKRALLVGLIALIASCGAFGWALRRDEGYTTARANIFAHICILAAYSGIWFFGLFSPAPAIVPFGVAFFALGQSRTSVFAGYASCAGLYVLLWGLVVSGALADRGLVHSNMLSTPQQLIAVALVEGIFLATFLLQRSTRAATSSALEEHDRAIRSLAQRDALLREARVEIAQAMQVGGVGRWTDEVVGGFRLERVIGRGAMGEVYEAVRVRDGATAAVKLLHPQVLAQPDFVQRFVREARIVASLDVAHVVRVLDVSPPDAPMPYLAMERLFGRDLSEYLREHKRMGIRSVSSMLRQVGMGLDAARLAGVVHRDLKPRNLFYAREGERDVWKILDFGVARVAGEETLTQNQIIGTPNYMAPEQANGAAVTHRTDLFALGVIAYRALTGHPAFEGETTAEVLYKVVHSMPLRPSAAAPLAAELDLALAVAIAKDPGDRFASAGELATALEDAARGRLEPAFRVRGERLLASLPWAVALE
jgi:hypothetical protein